MGGGSYGGQLLLPLRTRDEKVWTLDWVYAWRKESDIQKVTFLWQRGREIERTETRDAENQTAHKGT